MPYPVVLPSFRSLRQQSYWGPEWECPGCPRVKEIQTTSSFPLRTARPKHVKELPPCILKSKAATGIYRVLWAGVKALEMRIWPSSLSWELGQDTPGRGRGGTWQLKRILHRKAPVSPEINRNLCKKCCQIQVEGCYLWLSLLSICSIHFTLSLSLCWIENRVKSNEGLAKGSA